MDQEVWEENERKKECLKSYQKAVRREERILQEIQRLRLDRIFPEVINDGMPHGSSQTDLSDYIILVDEQIDLLKQERLEKAKIRSDIEGRIRELKDDDEQDVLKIRYIKGVNKWEDVAKEMNYSLRKIHKLHSSALIHLKI